MMPRRRQQGVALLEAMIACVILAIGLLGTVGLQARAYSAMNDAGARAEAVIASERLFGMMNTDQGANQVNLANYALVAGGAPGAALLPWYTATRAAIPNATISVVIAATGIATTQAVTITIKWRRKPTDVGDQNQNIMTSYLSLSS